MERNLKVFVVDDVRSARMVARCHLEELRFQVVEFDNGAACLDALKTTQGGAAPNILLLDVEMPGMDGIAFCRAIRAAGNEGGACHIHFVPRRS